ncbi:MAG: glycosyltransferase family 4 protein [Polyangiaceae bacterium]
MRVLFVTRKYPPRIGGMESLSHGLTTGYPEPKTTIALRRSQKHLIWFLPYVVLRVAFTAHRYDVIHLGDAMLSVAGLVPRVLWRRKVAVSVHGLDLTWPNAAYQAYLKRFLRADVFIANSESTKRIGQAHGLAPVRTILIGVPERYFGVVRGGDQDAELLRKAAGRVVLVTLGRLVRRKGVLWFVRNVLPKLSGVLYLVIGVGADREEIERAAAEAGVTDSLWLAGSVPDARLLSLLGASDIFVMPNIAVSGDAEGFGIVAIEAAASGLPVVASRLEGIPDAISDGNNGNLVPPEDAASYLSLLQGLVADADERRRQGERGRAYTQEHCSWPQIIAQYVALFDELVGS